VYPQRSIGYVAFGFLSFLVDGYLCYHAYLSCLLRANHTPNKHNNYVGLARKIEKLGGEKDI
jgi:hypothetical protein